MQGQCQCQGNLQGPQCQGLITSMYLNFFKAITLIYVQLFFNTQNNMLEELLFQMLFAQLATS